MNNQSNERMRTIEAGYYRVDAIEDVRQLPETLRNVVAEIWAVDKNTWCILTDHDFTEAEAKETLEALQEDREDGRDRVECEECSRSYGPHYSGTCNH